MLIFCFVLPIQNIIALVANGAFEVFVGELHHGCDGVDFWANKAAGYIELVWVVGVKKIIHTVECVWLYDRYVIIMLW